MQLKVSAQIREASWGTLIISRCSILNRVLNDASLEHPANPLSHTFHYPDVPVVVCTFPVDDRAIVTRFSTFPHTHSASHYFALHYTFAHYYDLSLAAHLRCGCCRENQVTVSRLTLGWFLFRLIRTIITALQNEVAEN